MLNPLSKNRNYLTAYLATWLSIMLMQAFIIFYFYDVNWKISIADSITFNTIFAIVGYNLWYVVRFNLKETSSVFDMLVNHVVVAVIIVSAWIGGSWLLLTNTFSDSSSYHQFLNDSLPWRVIMGIFYYLLFIMYYYIMLYYEDLQEKLKIEAELHGLVQQAELNALKSQINPHFLFNSLNSISSLTITNPDKAQDMVIKLSDFLRYSLSHDKNEKASLKQEFENLQRYLDIEKIRFGKRLNFSTEIPAKCLNQQIPNMILQPLIENAIKHGVYHSTEEVLVELKCTEKDNFVIIEISNEYDPDAVKKVGQGIGLSNIKKRLQLIYHRQDLLEIIAEKIVFRAIIKLPKT